MVLSAVMIPVFLLLTALVVDVGNWYTHKRQLQNRADAAALAAGLEYGPQIYRCLSGNPTEVANAETEISQQARAYAGDPTYVPAVGGGPDGLPDPTAATNTEIAKQSNIQVWLNSTSYDGPNGSDGGGPCLSRTVGDDVSNAGGTNGSPQWVDVKVKESDTASLFGGFGLNLLRNGARARVELRPAKGITGFVPLGVPDDRIAKARAFFTNDCTGERLGSVLTLKPLAAAYQLISGVTLWGPDDGAGNSTTSPVPVTFTMPAGLTGCQSGQDYVPISVEVRAAGRPDIDLDPPVTCATLAAKPQADCWPHTATIRAWATTGDPGGPLSGDTVLVEDVSLTGSGGSTACVQDPYYSRLTQGAAACTMDASVYLDFDKRYALGGTYTATLGVGGTNYPLTGPTTTQGNWIATGISVPLQDPVASIPVTVNWTWKYKGPGTFGGDDCSKGSGCQQSGTVSVHRVFPTDNGSDFDTLTAVKLTSMASSGEQHTVKLTSSTGGQRTYSGYLRVGLKSTLTLGQFSVLRLRSGQRNYSLVCDPRFPTPSTSNTQAAFYFGCQPPYDKNPLTNNTYWWSNYDTSDPEPECPGYADWFKGTGTPPGPPYPQSPWLCVHADPGNNGFAVTD
ncbi:MAG TPA: pilus assembly protein TadG-related protein, partial [Gaiella sp.]|nr:pilus assembly protein TadG-related protein [Gaiella sp.]